MSVVGITLIVVASFLILAIQFVIFAFWGYKSCEINEKNSTVVTGKLVCFRREVVTHGLIDTNPEKHLVYDEDYTDNAPERKPVMRFTLNGKEFERAAKVPAPYLTTEDIGKEFQLRCTKKYGFIIDDEESHAQLKKYQKKATKTLLVVASMFLIFATVAFLFGLCLSHFVATWP